MNDLHRHDMFSKFDGFGKPIELARLAKKLGHTALSTSNHGNTNGLIQTYKACKEEGLKAILGVEGYFLPVYKEQERGYHLCLFAKNLQGYENLNTIQYEGEKQKYYNPIWTFELLEKYHEGLICTTACIASYSAQCILNGKEKQARKYLQKLQSIFDDDLYIEIQPYVVSEKGQQETVNLGMMALAEELDIKCVLTSDSHRGAEDDFDTYLKMHQMDGHDPAWVEGTYKERYMPTEQELIERFVKMHKKDVGKAAVRMAKGFMENLEELEAKVEEDILGGLELQLPKIGGSDSFKEIVRLVKKGLKERGKYTDEYITRCKEELAVIKANGFIDYFLIVADYATWAKEHGIAVGPGRGSVCNCLVAYALHITDVDSLLFDLDFRRFMRVDKKAFPDIDLDFARERRDEVIEYCITKYKNHAARVASYGLYKVDNTVNELAKVCGLPIDKTVDTIDAKRNKEIISEIKRIVREYIDDSGELNADGLLYGADQKRVEQLNDEYDNIFIHFSKLYNKVRYIGTHSAGVVITSGNILSYTSLRTDKEGNLYASYNLDDLNDINIIKFDLLGLKTMQSISECRELEGIEGFDEEIVNDKVLLEQFRLGRTDGVFQLEKAAARKILETIECDSFDDVMATNALNRPGPLKQKMHEMYAENKANVESAKSSQFYEYCKESYGTVIFQEQLMLICVNIGGYTWPEADRMLKMTKHGKELALRLLAEEKKKGNDYKKKFFTNALKHGMSREEIEEIWEAMLVYSFNKGHAAGYSLVSMEEMYYKVYHPVTYWYVKIKYANNEGERERFCNVAVKEDVVLFLPHINYSQPRTSMRTVDGEKVLQKGLTDIKGIGEKAAEYIYAERRRNGIFRSYDDFYDRCKSRTVTQKVINILLEQGALEFNKKRYIQKTITYNSSLYSRG